jgi:ABC-type branched-subunit amino acid transport system permease subunit
MSNAVQTIAIIGGLGALIGLIVGIQTFWIARSLDRLDVDVRELRKEHREDIRLVMETLSEVGLAVTRLDERISRLEHDKEVSP